MPETCDTPVIDSPDLEASDYSTGLGLLYAIRPWQWYKQLILFVAVVFSGAADDLSVWLRVAAGALVFSLTAGAAYVLNDVSDIEEDRHHPRKRHRPIASGRVTVPVALGFVACVYLLTGGLAWQLDGLFFLLVVTYVLQNVAYSYVLKRIAFVDLLSISVGFVIRAAAGIALVGSPMSPWLLFCSFLTALLLAVTKRWGEVQETDATHRSTLDAYSRPLLQFLFGSVATTLLASYSMYTFFARDLAMMMTLPFAFYAIFRFTYLTLEADGASDPARLLSDRAMVVNVCVWAAVVVLVLYQPFSVGTLLEGLP